MAADRRGSHGSKRGISTLDQGREMTTIKLLAALAAYAFIALVASAAIGLGKLIAAIIQ
jgi:hypothetical protein